MIYKELFHVQNLDVFMPNDGVEYIYSILQNIGYKDFTTKNAREHGLLVLNQLFDLEIIEIFNWGKYSKTFERITFNKEQIKILIENIWFLGADYSDFINMPMFKHKDWYLESLEKKGLTSTNNWKIFVKEQIGDLGKWIEENRPENTNHNTV